MVVVAIGNLELQDLHRIGNGSIYTGHTMPRHSPLKELTTVFYALLQGKETVQREPSVPMPCSHAQRMTDDIEQRYQ